MMRTIEGNGLDGTVRINGTRLDPGPSLAVREHSPTGFAWGYGGSGPSQLALAILMTVEPNVRVALALYHDFKFEIVTGWPVGQDFRVRIDIEAWIMERREKAELWAKVKQRAEGGGRL